MRATLWAGLCLLVAVTGCAELKTSSRVQMVGNIEAKMNGRVRTEVPTAIDYGPVIEVPVGPGVDPNCHMVAGCKVAIIDIDGLISNVNHSGPYSVGENPMSLFSEKLDAAAADPQVKAVVLRINSLGGGVAASDQMWHELQQFRASCHKPVVASLLDVGCGGGYYLAAGCDTIVALPTGVVGGMGVLLNLYEAKEGMSLMSIFDNSIRSGLKVDMGSPVRVLSREEKEILRGMASSYHERFKDVVVKARPRIKRDSELFDGRVMTGVQALDVGLVDSLGYLDDAVHMAAQLAKTESAVAILYRRQGDAARSLYATTPNRPIHPSTLPMSIPGMERSKLPLFLYMWQVEPTFVRMNGI